MTTTLRLEDDDVCLVRILHGTFARLDSYFPVPVLSKTIYWILIDCKLYLLQVPKASFCDFWGAKMMKKKKILRASRGDRDDTRTSRIDCKRTDPNPDSRMNEQR